MLLAGGSIDNVAKVAWECKEVDESVEKLTMQIWLFSS